MYTTYTIPKALGGGDLVMRELTVGEIKDTMKAAGSASQLDVVEDLVRASLYSLRGKLCRPGTEGEAEYRALPPKLGTFITQAYTKIHSTTDAEDAAFFASATTSKEPPKAL
jgi:hypothetical protein